MTAGARRDKQLFRWDRRCAGSGGYAIALIASLVVTTTASPAAAAYWYGGGHKHRTAHKAHEPKAADRVDREPFGQIQKGPLQIFISINQQKLHLYGDGVHVADTSIATGVPSLPTPLGVFSVIQKQVFHRSNIYSGAPMPYMQRITWSGVAMHEGESIGHRASHGCIRMPHDFAVRLYRLTKLNTRVIIANSELEPTEFTDPHLFVHKEIPPEVASPADPVDNGATAARSGASVRPHRDSARGERGDCANDHSRLLAHHFGSRSGRRNWRGHRLRRRDPMSRCSAANLPNRPPRWVERRPSRLDMAKSWIPAVRPQS
jgi:L,D-transpeptidase catalytic domain